MKEYRRVDRDYQTIKFYLESNGVLWHGPFCPHANVHYKIIHSSGVSSSYLPKFSIEISPIQAVTWLKNNYTVATGGYL